MSKFDHTKIPESLRKRRGERAAITIWFGLLPLIFGGYGIYQYFTTTDQTYTGSPEAVFYRDHCGEKIVQEHCLYLVIYGDTLQTYLSEDGLEKCLALIDNYPVGLQLKMDSIPEYDKARKKLVKNNYQTDKLQELYKFVNSVSVTHVNSTIKSLEINQIKIITYQSALWLGMISLVIGIAWIAIHINFYIKDPYKVYR